MAMCLVAITLAFHHIFQGMTLLLNALHTMLLSILLLLGIHLFLLRLCLILSQIPLLLMVFLLLVSFLPCIFSLSSYRVLKMDGHKAHPYKLYSVLSASTGSFFAASQLETLQNLFHKFFMD